MAIAWDAATDGGNAAGNLTFAHTVGSGSNRILWVSVLGSSVSSADVSGVTYAGTAMTLIASKQANSGRFIYLFYLVAPATGSNNVVITSASNFTWGGASSYSGASQTGVPDASNTGDSGASATSWTDSVTTTANNCWTVIAGRSNAGGIGAGASTTQRASESAFGTANICDSNAAVTPAGSASLTITGIGGDWLYGVMASFAPAGAGGGGTVVHQSTMTSMGIGG